MSGAIGISVIGSSLSIMVRYIAFTAFSFNNSSFFGSGKSNPSIPLAPCTLEASTSSQIKGCAAPAATGTSLPKNASRRSALFVTLSSDTFPATVVISFTSSSSENRAIAIASASSIPGSVSIIIGLLLIISSFYSLLIQQSFNQDSCPFLFTLRPCKGLPAAPHTA